MRFVLCSLALILTAALAQAQSIMDNIPPAGAVGEVPTESAPAAKPAPTADTYTVADVNADVTADTAAHARDQALMQAEHAAYTQLCARLTLPDSAAKLDDDALASLVQSFEVQSEKASAVRYIGVFTIRFKPAAVQKKFAKALSTDASTNPLAVDPVKPMPTGPMSHLAVAVNAESLPAWTQIKRRINAVPQVAHIDVIDLGRGVSHIDLSYAGNILDLQQALTAQGLILRQTGLGAWEIFDGSMVAR